MESKDKNDLQMVNIPLYKFENLLRESDTLDVIRCVVATQKNLDRNLLINILGIDYIEENDDEER